MDYEEISAFLGGTVGTLIVKGISDFYSKNRDHKQHLQKLSYERKLEVGEAAIAFFSYYRYNIVNLRSGLKAAIDTIESMTANDDENGILTDLTGIEASMVRVSAAIDEMFGNKYQEILSMNLYFNFPASNTSMGENITEMFTAIGQSKATDNDIAYFIKQSNDAEAEGNIEGRNYYYQYALSLLPAYKAQIETILEMMEQDVVNTVSNINTIKSQLKIY